MNSPPERSDLRQQGLSHVERARKLYADFASGDVPAVLESFDPRIEWREADGHPYQPGGAPFRGPQEVVDKLFARIGQEWHGFSVAPEAFHASQDGAVVVVEGRYTGTFTATHRGLDAEFCHVLTYRDGKLARFRQYSDTEQFRAVMGA